MFPLCAQVLDPPLCAGFEATTGQDHGASADIHEALGGLCPYSLDAPLSRGQEVQHYSVVDHANAPPFGRTELPLRQARAALPELDHGASRKVNATTMAHGRLVQLKAHPQALHPAQRL